MSWAFLKALSIEMDRAERGVNQKASKLKREARRIFAKSARPLFCDLTHKFPSDSLFFNGNYVINCQHQTKKSSHSRDVLCASSKGVVVHSLRLFLFIK
jgi:hypothetical protein